MQRQFSSPFDEKQIEEYDVVVVGAGLSGLVAAYRIVSCWPQCRIKIIEARDSIGGRINSVELPAANNSIDIWDLGGTWIGDQHCQPLINKLISQLGISSYPQNFKGRKILQIGSNNKICDYDSSIPDVGLISLIDTARLIKNFEIDRKELFPKTTVSQNKAQYLDSITSNSYFKQKIWTSCTNDCTKSFIRATFGSEMERLSAYYVLIYANCCGGLIKMMESSTTSSQGYKIVGGAQSICEELLKYVGQNKIVYKTPVHSISQIYDEYNEPMLIVETLRNEKLKAKHVVIAIPPHLVSTIQIYPPLNPIKYDYYTSVSPGHLIKVILTYEKAFWREEGFSGEIVTNGGPSITEGCSNGPLSVVFDATTDNDNPALIGLIGGVQASQYEMRTKEERKEAVLESLGTYFNSESVRNFIVYCEKIWRQEPFVGGCPVSLCPPGVGKLLMTDEIRKPENGIHFAGSELANNWMGFMEGAVDSGERVANEILNNNQ